MHVGIEAMNVFGGTAYLDVIELAKYRKLDAERFNKLMMKEKAVALPYEDPISYGINAAKPIIDSLTEEERNRIELLITCTESGVDFSKSMSTYIHQYLGLNRNCRLMEMKQACYSGTAGFQMGINFILSSVSKGAKALIICTDISRYIAESEEDVLSSGWLYAEPSSGAGAVALLISDEPYIFQIDIGANGYYGYEVMDTCRPVPDIDAGDVDLSLLSYLDCCEQAYMEYQKRVTSVDYQNSFQYLAYHTPFGGMVKGAHRNMMRKMTQGNPAEIEKDFNKRVLPSLNYGSRVGNIMGGSMFLALASAIDQGVFEGPKRIGCFSYGSGCCSEFFSGIVTPEGKKHLKKFEIERHLNNRYRLSMDEYHSILANSDTIKFGTENTISDFKLIPDALVEPNGTPYIFLTEIKGFHREYGWVS